MPNARQQRKLENHLTLHGWLNSHFGYKTTRDLLNDVKNEAEGFNPDGQSSICNFLLTRAEPDSQIAEVLPTYDANIKRHLSAINNKRTQPIVFRYFQYLSLLYAEIFLDWKFNKQAKFLPHLNNFVQTQNMAKAPGDAQDTEFTQTDIEKLAFWMATGAGKTLIMHINYHQFRYYCKDPLDHIVLITPNEGLSEQHIRELTNSDIRCQRFNVEGNHLTQTHDTIQVIEITKLVEEKTSGGVSVPVEAFEGNNLIFVDEGHKGSGGKVWREYREALAETGFTFEYSATFGQALAAASNADLIDEYGKAIAFDYSYRYFYEDGYGKNFRILNVKHDDATQTETLLLGNLLSFYEQRRYYKEQQDAVQTYGLDPPLWAFVGSKVNAIYTEKKKPQSDVLNIIRFLHQFLKNENGWTINTIKKILNDDSGLKDDNGIDIFKSRLSLLKEKYQSVTPTQIYNDILMEIFHTDSSGALHLCVVRNSQGEIALKSSHGGVFGLIYIGKTSVSSFKKLVEKEIADIETDPEDVFTESLFHNINTLDSPINILIGAKKFIEGWDSWRVTAMGLLNVGTNEGSQIIQLFGRGVRLRGKNMSLKRSTPEDKERPDNLPLLETLNIFAVRANFMAQFRDYLMREGVPTEEPFQMELPIKPNLDHLANRLFIPDVQPYDEAAEGQCVPLEVIPGIYVTHTTQSIEIIGSSSQTGIRGERAQAALTTTIPEPSLKLVNWEKIYLQLLEYKHDKGYTNLMFNTEILEQILNPEQPAYKLTVMDESEVIPTSLIELERLEELVLTLLRKYISKFYRIIQKRWNDERLKIKLLDKENDNFTNWNVSIPQEEASNLKPQIEYLIENEDIYGPNFSDLPNIHNERHLYQPLLTVGGAETTIRTSPPALEESEEHFVKDLRSFVRQYRQELLTKKEIYLLRNQSRGKGIGFYQNEGFYPDFILWILEGVKQRIVFIEPHGMIYDAINENNEKITLFKRFRTLSHERFRGEHVKMDAFMISKTSIQDLQRKYPDISKESFADDWHILFRDPVNLDYLSPIFQDSDLGTSF